MGATAAAAARASTDEHGFPLAPGGDAKRYGVWRSRLPRVIQTKITAHCRDHGGEFQQVCNGIGPLAVPPPPSLDLADQGRRDEWLHSLSSAQRYYVAQYCELNPNDAGSFKRGYSELCGGMPVVVAFGSDRVQWTGGAQTGVPTVATPWLARDVNGDGTITTDELFGVGTGLAALAALDLNHDGQLDAADPAFDALLVWADRDPDSSSSVAKKIIDSASRRLDYP